ncbi:MAG: hypothetical protein WC861_04750 [Candidatus Micrarchaeia archaeon]
MPPSAPKAPAEPDWEMLRQKKPAFSVEHINEIAELSARYLDADAVVFSEDDIISNFYLLWQMSKKPGKKISKRHAKEIEKIVMSVFSKHASESNSRGTPSSPQKDHPNKFKPGSDELAQPSRAKNIFSRGWQYQQGKRYLSKADATGNEGQKREYCLKAAECFEKSGSNRQTGHAYNMVAEYSESLEDKEIYSAKAGDFYVKAGKYGWAGGAYQRAGNAAKDAGKGSPVYESYYAKAEENNAKEGGIAFKKGDLQEALNGYHYAAYNAKDRGKKAEYCLKMAEIAEKREGWGETAMIHYGEVAIHIPSDEKSEFYLQKAKTFADSDEARGYLSEKCGVERECSDAQKEKLFVSAAADYRKAKDPERVGHALENAAKAATDDGKQAIYLMEAAECYKTVDRPDLEAVALISLVAVTADAREKEAYRERADACMMKAESKYKNTRLENLLSWMYLVIGFKADDSSKSSEYFVRLAENCDNDKDRCMAYVEAVKRATDSETKLSCYRGLALAAANMNDHELAGFGYGEIGKLAPDSKRKAYYSVLSAKHYLKQNATVRAACAYFNAAQYAEKAGDARKYSELAQGLVSKAVQEVLAAKHDEKKQAESLQIIYAQAHVATADPRLKENYYSKFLETGKVQKTDAKLEDYRNNLAQFFEGLASETEDNSQRSEYFAEAGRNYYNLKMQNKAIECYRLAVETCEDKMKRLSYELLLDSISGKATNLN